MDKYEKFKEQVYKLTSINLDLYKEKQMKRRITSLMTRNGFNDFDKYFEEIRKDKNIFEEFINYITINVSEFFRNPKQWEVLEKNILPELIKNNRSIKIWSSASSTGEEPYTLVMLLTKFYKLENIKILATDLDKTAIESAKVGIYNEKSIQNVPKEFMNKFFEKEGSIYKIKESIKKCVEFKQLNLLEDSFPKGNHLILCRNVMIYFTDDAKTKLYNKFYESLNDKGIFFVGSTEQIILPDKYNLKPLRTFFYTKAKKS